MADISPQLNDRLKIIWGIRQACLCFASEKEVTQILVCKLVAERFLDRRPKMKFADLTFRSDVKSKVHSKQTPNIRKCDPDENEVKSHTSFKTGEHKQSMVKKFRHGDGRHLPVLLRKLRHNFHHEKATFRGTYLAYFPFMVNPNSSLSGSVTAVLQSGCRMQRDQAKISRNDTLIQK